MQIKKWLLWASSYLVFSGLFFAIFKKCYSEIDLWIFPYYSLLIMIFTYLISDKIYNSKK